MYKALIIDDELPSREAIRILGEWDRLGVGEIREAADGKAGLDIVREWRPDLVLVDMKMPEMDGAEFLKRAQEVSPGMFTIVISGFDNFEYTRQAIQSKVVEYLLKPVIRRELNQALENAIAYLEARKKQANESIDKDIVLNMSLPKLKEKICLSLIERQFHEPTQASSLKLIGADSPDTRFCIAALRVLNLEEVKQRKFQKDGSLLHFALTNVINEVGTDAFSCFSFANPKQERELIALFQFQDTLHDELRRQSVASFLAEVCRTVESMFGVSMLAGVGSVTREAAGIADSYDSALRKLLSANMLAGAGPVITEEAAERPDEVFALTGRIQTIRGALQDYNPQLLQGVGEDFIGRIRKSGSFSYGDAIRAISDIDILLRDLAQEIGVPSEELDGAGDSRPRAEGIPYDFRNFDEFESLFYRVLEYYGEKVRQRAKAGGGFHIRDIKDYIDHRYSEEINVSTFTERYFLSREYLMKLFKQEYGMGIYEYVLKVRMDKAKELLQAPHLKIQNISDMVGYKDKNYFSKAFKNAFGLSPSEYRQQYTSDRGE